MKGFLFFLVSVLAICRISPAYADVAFSESDPLNLDESDDSAIAILFLNFSESDSDDSFSKRYKSIPIDANEDGAVVYRRARSQQGILAIAWIQSLDLPFLEYHQKHTVDFQKEIIDAFRAYLHLFRLF